MIITTNALFWIDRGDEIEYYSIGQNAYKDFVLVWKKHYNKPEFKFSKNIDEHFLVFNPPNTYYCILIYFKTVTEVKT